MPEVKLFWNELHKMATELLLLNRIFLIQSATNIIFLLPIIELFNFQHYLLYYYYKPLLWKTHLLKLSLPVTILMQ